MSVSNTERRYRPGAVRTAQFAPRLILWLGIVGVGIGLGILTVMVYGLPSRIAPLVILAALFPFVAMIAGGVRKLLLAVVVLDIPLNISMHLDYREDVASLGAVGGMEISATTVALAGLYALWFAEALARKRLEARPWFRLSFLAILYVIFLTLSITAAQDMTLSSFTIALAAQLILLFIYIVGTVRTREDVNLIIGLLLVSLLMESLMMIALYFLKYSVSVAGVTARIDYDPTSSVSAYRVGGTVGSPNSAGAYLSLLLAPALSVLLTQHTRSYKILAALSFGFGAIALLLTFTRGAWVATVVSIALLLFFAAQRGWLSLRMPAVLIAVTAILMVFFPNMILERFTEDDAGSALARIPLMQIAWRMIVDHPVLGVGTNNFAIAVKEYITPEFSRDWIYIVHNRYLSIWAEAGLGAVATFVGFLLVTLRRGWQGWQAGDRTLSPLALGLTTALIGHMYHLTVDVFNGRPTQQLVFLIAGLIAAMTLLGQSQPDLNTSESQPTLSPS